MPLVKQAIEFHRWRPCYFPTLNALKEHEIQPMKDKVGQVIVHAKNKGYPTLFYYNNKKAQSNLVKQCKKT